jgi:hypothetical protein
VFKDDPTVNLQYDQKDEGETWLKKRTAKAFYQPVIAPTIRQGAIALLQVYINCHLLLSGFISSAL